MKTIFSEEELSVMEALEVKGGRTKLKNPYEDCKVVEYCPGLR